MKEIMDPLVKSSLSHVQYSNMIMTKNSDSIINVNSQYAHISAHHSHCHSHSHLNPYLYHYIMLFPSQLKPPHFLWPLTTSSLKAAHLSLSLSEDGIHTQNYRNTRSFNYYFICFLI